ncbi:pleckstrin homology domain-containing family A member 5-like isoform X2 [Chrysemys picta bellii]|uniref:pleckstrin homology domain-containing family A member 5-like isoform X2 n=1 Tax=Chrysemys picta bellii TaxID=8478 RepID=UPI0032B0FAF8
MADLSAERLCSLPGNWSYGISQGGRLFFINEEAKSTTWLHPHTGEAVITGHRRSAENYKIHNFINACLSSPQS